MPAGGYPPFTKGSERFFIAALQHCMPGPGRLTDSSPLLASFGPRLASFFQSRGICLDVWTQCCAPACAIHKVYLFLAESSAMLGNAWCVHSRPCKPQET